jgi:hypothetical protein
MYSMGIWAPAQRMIERRVKDEEPAVLNAAMEPGQRRRKGGPNASRQARGLFPHDGTAGTM